MSEEGLTDAEIEAASMDVIRDILLIKGLYSSFAIDSPIGEAMINTLRNDLKMGYDSYCIGCKRETVFRISPRPMSTNAMGSRYHAATKPPDLFAVNAVCQRGWHVYTYVFIRNEQQVTKIGQTPSLADIAFGELKAFDKALSKQDRAELGRALGLFAHDSAIGAFVYLRRVFERMIARAYERRKADGGLINGFEGMPMDQKIGALKGDLPEKIVKNSSVFSVLSLGIHELSEEKALTIFPVVKAVLFQMLEHEEHQRLAAITEAETERALQSVIAGAKAD